MSLVSISDLFDFEKGSLQSSKNTPGEFDFITASSEWKNHNEFTHNCEALIFAAAASGSLGRTHYVNGKFITSDLCFIITPKNENKYPIDLKFYHIIFNTFKEDIVKNTKAGTSKEAIGLKSFGNYKLPYFDINVQKEIRKKINLLKRDTFTIDFELTNQLNLIKQLRQSFLREAMQGKLVSNDTKDGKTGAELLAEIQTEKEKLIKEKKIKRGKLQEAETLEELIFDIPNNWIWTEIDNISINITDGTHQTPTYTKSGRVFLSAQNVKPFRFIPEIHKYVSEEDYQNYIKNRLAEKGDLLVARVGAGIGETAVISKDIEFAFYVSLGLIKPFKNHINSFYLEYVFNSPYGVSYAKGNVSSKGGSAGNFNLGRIRSFLIPLPPLEIQERIVSKLDELMQYCDQLETSVKESQKLNEQLLQQVLRESLQPKAKEVVLPLVAEDREEYNTANKSLKICDNGSITILAGYIIKKLSTSNPKDFGRVKLQKMLHLVEYQCKLETELHYKQKVAGPYAWELENVIEPKLKTYRFFDIKQDKLSLNNKVTYTALANAKELDFLFQKQFAEISDSINSLLQKFNNKSWEFCEMISTMYAVWNNRIIKNQTINKEELKKDFLAWEEKKIKYQDQIDYAIEWMKKEDLVPIGFGKYIEK